MRVIICGGRDFTAVNSAWRALDFLDRDLRIATVIEGGAMGADRVGREWALARQKQVITFPADWENHGRKAGPIRNQEMIDQGRPDAVVFFPGGRGTEDMVRRAKAADIRLIAMCVGDMPEASGSQSSEESR